MNFSNPDVQNAFDEYELSIEATVDNLDNNYKQLRAGRANAHVLDNVRVDYYGALSPINQVGNISVPEARVLVINVWDSSMLKAVEKAILAANIGITPNNDGKCIRLVFPELTADRRKQLVKDIKVQADNNKVVLRNHRRDINDALKKLKNNGITEDELASYEKEVDKILAKAIEKVDEIFKIKEKELLSI